MANTHDLFQTFCGEITLAPKKRDSLKTSRDALRSDIKDWFSEKNKKQPKFCWQGSFSMKTLVNPLNGSEYDLDDGVYLQDYDDADEDDWPSPATTHTWVKDAVSDHTKSSPIDKDTCIRVPYAADYHIDLPIYIVKDDVAYLAHKTKGWIESDPKAFRSWFIDKVTDENHYGEQLRRIVKYLKSWKDNKSIALKGVELTILATNSFDKYDERDDKCLRNTVSTIITSLESNFTCIKPVCPYEDLFDDISQAKKDSILSAFQTLKSDLDNAINEDDKKKASEYIRNSFGSRFPLAQTSTVASYAASHAPGVLRNDGRSA